MQALGNVPDCRGGVQLNPRQPDMAVGAQEVEGGPGDMHARELKEGGASDERLWTLATWRDSTSFNEAERAALALTEAATRLADREDPVTDCVRARTVVQQVVRHHGERR